MYCGEPDFQHCIQSITSQENVTIHHKTFSYMTKIAAHNAVYQAFNEADPSWYRAKIDADVVLLNNQVLSSVVNDLMIRKSAIGLNPLVHDFMTDSEINAGISFYTSACKFNTQTNPLKCDRDIISDETRIREMGLVGSHMRYADARTAFRYGLHRGLKSQMAILDLVKKAYAKHRDPIRAMALKGFEIALSDPRFSDWHKLGTNIPDKHNYADTEFLELFRQADGSLNDKF
jgi:hypothetical protein